MDSIMGSSPRWYVPGQERRLGKRAILGVLGKLILPPSFSLAIAQAILNEPAGFTSPDFLSTTRQFTIDAFYAARYPFGNDGRSGLLIVYSDAFQPSEFGGQTTQ
jgi:hypothetical protein